MTVSGAGSAWNSGSQLQMGYGGDATLSILDGGTARFAGSATLGSIAYSYDPATGIRQASQQGTAAVRVGWHGPCKPRRNGCDAAPGPGTTPAMRTTLCAV